MRIILLALFYFLTLSISGQKKYPDRKINGYQNGGYITLNLLSLADLGLPTVQPGFEYKVNDRLGFEAAYGIPVKYGFRAQKTDSTYNNYFKLRGTVRYYIYYHTGYLGLETFYTHSHYTSYKYEYSGKSGQNYISDFAESRRSVFGFDVKYAWIFRIARKFYVENFIGLGPRFVNITLPVNINPVMTPPRGGLAFHIRKDELGTNVDLYITVGLQLVYRL